jgi:hypothetical protein
MVRPSARVVNIGVMTVLPRLTLMFAARAGLSLISTNASPPLIRSARFESVTICGAAPGLLLLSPPQAARTEEMTTAANAARRARHEFTGASCEHAVCGARLLARTLLS